MVHMLDSLSCPHRVALVHRTHVLSLLCCLDLQKLHPPMRRLTPIVKVAQLGLCTSSRQCAQGFGNLFSFLSLPMDARCSTQDVQRHYHKLQAKLHPDVSPAGAPSSGRNVDSSSYANAAYETLRNPFSRCRYLLKYLVAEQRNNGKPLSASQEEDVYFSDDSRENLGGTGEDGKAGSSLEDAFLSEMMEYNEIVFSMDPEQPTEDDKETLQKLEEHILEMDARYEAEACAAWGERNVDRFRSAVLHWTYVDNLKRHIHQRK